MPNPAVSGDAVPLILRVFTAYSPLIFLLLRTGLILTARPLKWAQKEGGGGPKNGHTKCQIIVIKPIHFRTWLLLYIIMSFSGTTHINRLRCPPLIGQQ